MYQREYILLNFFFQRHKNNINASFRYYNSFLFKAPKYTERRNGLKRRAKRTSGMNTKCKHYFLLHSPLLKESWLVSFITLRWLICLSLARILAWADVQYEKGVFLIINKKKNMLKRKKKKKIEINVENNYTIAFWLLSQFNFFTNIKFFYISK